MNDLLTETVPELAQGKRKGASVNAHLVLKQGGKVLLLLRKNTNYYDGMWGFAAGHVEDGEPATQGMIREAHEEIGIEILPNQLRVLHIMHRKTDRLNIDIFFDCLSWKGSIQNSEPEKCEKIDFFPPNLLPSNTIDYHAAALQAIAQGRFYTELGWS